MTILGNKWIRGNRENYFCPPSHTRLDHQTGGRWVVADTQNQEVGTVSVIMTTRLLTGLPSAAAAANPAVHLNIYRMFPRILTRRFPSFYRQSLSDGLPGALPGMCHPFECVFVYPSHCRFPLQVCTIIVSRNDLQCTPRCLENRIPRVE